MTRTEKRALASLCLNLPTCNGCGRELLTKHRATVADGCPCNSPRGVNHGLVPVSTCTCTECDPKQTGSARPVTH